ncbi:MAG TPA: hypothetical protein VHJ69_03365, partial [Gemmatimonadales bacterium]|nr:hypothetical protein [Gemmatimonadales bacterium]
QYFDWQWARSLDRAPRFVVTLVMAWLGLHGLFVQRAVDRGASRLLVTLFLVTGLGLVLYMNFKPGFSLAMAEWPNRSQHEVRERDYFFVASFVIWGLWIGIGLADVARTVRLRLAHRAGPSGFAATFAVLAAALLPLALNATSATRRGTPDARLAADIAYDLLNTVPPYGVLFTNGDNDTFPLWWAQEVAGTRPDVTVVCLSLAHTAWYPRQLRDRPLRSFDPASAPDVWRSRVAAAPSGPLHTMSDEEIDGIVAQRINRPLSVDIGPLRHTYPAGTVFYRGEVVALRIMQQSLGRRPVVWALTAGRELAGLSEYAVQQGVGLRLDTLPPDDADTTLYFGPGQEPLDISLSQQLMDRAYRYAGLESPGRRPLEPSAAGMARLLAGAMGRLAKAEAARGDSAAAGGHAERARRIVGP